MAIQAHMYSDNIGTGVGCSQDLIMDNGYAFNYHQFYNLQQQKQHFQQQMIVQDQFQPQVNQTMCSDTIINNPGNPVGSSIQCQMELQKRDFDQYMRLQNEKLLIMLEEYRKKQLGIMFKKIESKVSHMLKQKEAEISQAVKTTMDLEGYVKKLEMEKLQWQIIAQENEAKIVSLNNSLEELKDNYNNINFNNEVDDVESCCGDGDERAMLLVDDNGEQSSRKMVCKCCNSRNSCMLFLPCRHLCSCKKCEAFLDHCPVCGIIKKNAIEALSC